MSDNEEVAGRHGTASENANNIICAATVTLPDFWQHNPRPWFQHTEENKGNRTQLYAPSVHLIY